MLRDLTDYLASEGLGTAAVDLFESSMPDDPDDCLAVNGYQGRPPAFDHDSPLPAMRFPRVQVKVRDRSHDAALTRAQAAYTALCGVVNRTLGATTFLRITPLHEPFSLGQDDSRRWLVVCNYEVTL